MSWIEDLLRTPPTTSRDRNAPASRPRRRLAIVTCMDARIDPMGLFGLTLGDAHIVRNAGGRVTDDAVRSLVLSAHLFGVDTVVLVEHTGCGLLGATNPELQAATSSTIDFLPITDHDAALEVDVARIVAEPSLEPVRRIAGLVLDVDSGVLTPAVTWERSS